MSEGADLTLVSWGKSVFQCLEALGRATSPRGHHVRRAHRPPHDPYPIDIDTIAASVEKTGRCVIVHEAPPRPAAWKRRAFEPDPGAAASSTLKPPFSRVAGFDTVMPYYKLELEYLPDAKRIAEAVTQCLAY